MINSVAARINTMESFSLQDVEKSLAGLLTACRSSESGVDNENPIQIDCYTPSEQRLSEEALESLAAVQVKGKNGDCAENKDGKKKIAEDILNTLRDFFKAPSNLYLHKKLNDAAAEGDLEKASEMNDKKADYNMPKPVPGGEKHTTR